MAARLHLDLHYTMPIIMSIYDVTLCIFLATDQARYGSTQGIMYSYDFNIYSQVKFVFAHPQYSQEANVRPASANPTPYI
jgi:hypothetical protein